MQQLVGYEEPSKFTYAQRARGPLLALGLQAEMRASVQAGPDGVTWRVAFEEMRWSLLNGRLPLRRRKLPPGVVPAGPQTGATSVCFGS